METEDETVKEAKTEQETVKETRTEPETLKEAETETQTEPETLEEIELETQTELETAAAEIAQAEPITVSISSTKITPETTSITVNISSVPSMGILRVVQMDAEDVYESSKLNSYKSLHFSSAGSLKAGENTLALTASAEVGKKVLVVLRDSSGSSIVDAVSEPVMATVASQGGGEEPGNTKTPQEITGAPRVESDGEMKTTDTTWNLNIRGTIPEGAMILVKQYPGETTSFVTTDGTFAGSAFDVTKGSLTMNLTGTRQRETSWWPSC